MTASRSAVITVAVADDDLFVRDHLSDYLAATADLELLATCANGEQLVAQVQQRAPDVVLMDIQMPVMYCLTATRTLRDALIEAGYDEAELNGSWVSYKPVGCPACNNGYKGRVGIYQVMPISEEIQRIILRDGSALEIAAQAKAEGVRSLRDSGLHKVKLGLTSLEEVLAVTNE